MVPSNDSERGEGKIGCILSLLALVLVVAVGVKLAPVFYGNSNLTEAAGEVAGEAALYPIPSLESKLRAKAVELDIPEAVADGAIAITTSGGKATGTCTVMINYTRAVDFYGFYSLAITTRKVVTRPYMDSR
jgi:hypothetical protein